MQGFFEISFNQLSAQTEHPQTCGFEQALACLIGFYLGGMDWAIHFDHQALHWREEIHHERPNWLLSAEFNTIELAPSQRLPQPRLAGGGRLAKAPRCRDQALVQLIRNLEPWIVNKLILTRCPGLHHQKSLLV